jgi:excisionase family DNA binding protein
MVGSDPQKAAGMSNLERLTFTVDEPAALLRVSRNLAYAAVASGEIPSIKIGRRILVPRLALERLLDEASGKPAPGHRAD